MKPNKHALASWKLFLLMWGTLGLYYYWWYYRTWVALRSICGEYRSVGLKVLGLFVPIVHLFMIYDLYQNVESELKKHGIPVSFSPGWGVITKFFLGSLLGVFFPILIQRNLNVLLLKKEPDTKLRQGLSRREIVLALVIFLLWWSTIYSVMKATEQDLVASGAAKQRTTAMLDRMHDKRETLLSPTNVPPEPQSSVPESWEEFIYNGSGYSALFPTAPLVQTVEDAKVPTKNYYIAADDTVVIISHINMGKDAKLLDLRALASGFAIGLKGDVIEQSEVQYRGYDALKVAISNPEGGFFNGLILRNGESVYFFLEGREAADERMSDTMRSILDSAKFFPVTTGRTADQI
ncbi:MAG: hypothetical protein N2691_01535 [Patescibacteria group bacterium]|nr:hypothetical protein [Patescibacteria group bacterium]